MYVHTGLKNKTSCSKCRRRKGYSAFRKARDQSGEQVRLLYNMVKNQPACGSTLAKKASEILQRWGFHPSRRCCLHVTTDVDKLLVRIPGRDEVFPCLDYRDRMHSMFIFLWRVITEAICHMSLSRNVKRILDQRLAALCDRRCFRSDEGQAYRRQKSIFDGVGMTASDKICMMFLLPHVLGHTSGLIPPEVLESLLEAIARTQLILIACRGQRSYTESELETIFDRGYVVIFRCLDRIRRKELGKRMREHQADPDKYPLPKRFKCQTRCNRSAKAMFVNLLCNSSYCFTVNNFISIDLRDWPSTFTTPNTDTEDTSESVSMSPGGDGFYSHGNHCLQHQHWVQQVISSGSFGVHCTQSSEMKHKLVMHQASVRVRHLSINHTQSSMLHYLCLRSLFQEMKPKGHVPPPRKLSSGVTAILCDMKMGCEFHSPRFQERFLHREARVARVELLDLLCEKFGLCPRRASSYQKLQTLDYKIGQKLTRADGFVMWATDSRYQNHAETRNTARRDVLFLEGFETTPAGIRNALCCEAICFIAVSSTSEQFQIPANIPAENGHAIFILGRWFEPHSAVGNNRDSDSRPVCPGPLQINHCLWRYARARSKRRVMVSRRGQPTRSFGEQVHLFGESTGEQNIAFNLEQRAYFCLVSPETVLCRANMCPQFKHDSSEFDLTTWMQTVILI